MHGPPLGAVLAPSSVVVETEASDGSLGSYLNIPQPASRLWWQRAFSASPVQWLVRVCQDARAVRMETTQLLPRY